MSYHNNRICLFEEVNKMAERAVFIADNSNETKSVKKYLKEWCGISKQMDIATGYLEIGGLLDLDGDWQKLDKIRIILGDEMTKRTKEVIEGVVQHMISRLRDSVDDEHERNEFLIGVPAIIDAMQKRRIECRVYDKGKFHAKTYISYFDDKYKAQFPASFNIGNGYALVGSSNFTHPGLTQNIELNVQIRDNVDELQDWFEEYWEVSTDITEALLKAIENRCKEFSPYDVYLRSMYELFKSREGTVSDWEQHKSKIYPILSQYQKDGYNNLINIAEKYSGAFLCDGVGLGKTFEGMMVIERYVMKERKNVVLIVPAAARISVWETTIKQYMPEILEGFYPFKIINHTDLLLDKNQNLMDQIAKQAEVVVIDEAHHFRSRSSNRYRKLFEMMTEGPQKLMFMLTATPINNSFLDLQHLIELFTHRQDDYFAAAPLGIHSLYGHFKKMEAKLNEVSGDAIEDSIDIAEDVFRKDELVKELVVQRSRAYVKKSLLASTGSDQVLFSERQPPTVANYSLKSSYGKLIDDFMKSFYRKDKSSGKTITILSLAVYSPYEEEYYIGDRSKIDEMKAGRQKQVVNLVRQLLLKRFESSIAAFEETCIRIYIRLRKFMEDYMEYGNKKKIEKLFAKHTDIYEYITQHLNDISDISVEDMEDGLPDYVWNTEESFDIKDFDIRAMLDDTELDLEVLSEFIEDMMELRPEQDDKIRELKRILTEDDRVKNKKVIIFSEFRATALYIYHELQKAGFKGLYELDGTSNEDRHSMVQRFAPYYNGLSSADVQDEIRILVATDVLAEGLNLQDAQCLINYELHWNPVRLMQRIGRVDRRRSAVIEDRLLADHPELAADRKNAYYWNFLPPSELDGLLNLYRIVARKTLRISKTFGIEGKQLLTPDDHYDALRDFNSQYEGTASPDEEIALAWQKLLEENPDYETTVTTLPRKMYSGKLSSAIKGWFFCYELPNRRADNTWTDGDGLYRWYIVDPELNNIHETTYEIWEAIRCGRETARVLTCTEEEFTAARKVIEGHIKKNYLRQITAPMGVKARLVTWMQLV